MGREGRGSTVLQLKLPTMSLEQVKVEIFDGPQIKDSMFDYMLTAPELFTWQSLEVVSKTFLKQTGVQKMRKKWKNSWRKIKN